MSMLRTDAFAAAEEREAAAADVPAVMALELSAFAVTAIRAFMSAFAIGLAHILFRIHVRLRLDCLQRIPGSSSGPGTSIRLIYPLL